MPSDNELLDKVLDELGLSHTSMHIHFSEVQFWKPKKFQDFAKQVNDGFKQLLKEHPEAKGNLQIDWVAITFGHADGMIVWGATDGKWAKMFRDYVLATVDSRVQTMMCIANDGAHHG